MIIDDSITEKPYTNENDIICWHYDHSKDRTIKGINFLTALYHSAGLSPPIGFELIAKTERYIDPKDGKEKRRSKVNKNELYQKLLKQAVRNQITFKYVLNDVWFASAENMMFVKHDLKRHFVMPLKSNRKVALSLADKRRGRFVSVDTLDLQEPYHKSLKQNASLEKSPTRMVVKQTNHFFAALCGYIKLELLKGATNMNHFALKSKLYFSALQSAYRRLNSLQPVRLAA